MMLSCSGLPPKWGCKRSWTTAVGSKAPHRRCSRRMAETWTITFLRSSSKKHWWGLDNWIGQFDTLKILHSQTDLSLMCAAIPLKTHFVAAKVFNPQGLLLDFAWPKSKSAHYATWQAEKHWSRWRLVERGHPIRPGDKYSAPLLQMCFLRSRVEPKSWHTWHAILASWRWRWPESLSKANWFKGRRRKVNPKRHCTSDMSRHVRGWVSKWSCSHLQCYRALRSCSRCVNGLGMAFSSVRTGDVSFARKAHGWFTQ